jgi:hypothetical protein
MDEKGAILRGSLGRCLRLLEIYRSRYHLFENGQLQAVTRSH